MASSPETTDDEKLDAVTTLAHLISVSVDSLVRSDKITPDEAIRAVASSLWATVVAYGAPEHFESNAEFAVETFGACRDAATNSLKELEFDKQHQSRQWGNA